MSPWQQCLLCQCLGPGVFSHTVVIKSLWLGRKEPGNSPTSILVISVDTHVQVPNLDTDLQSVHKCEFAQFDECFSSLSPEWNSDTWTHALWGQWWFVCDAKPSNLGIFMPVSHLLIEIVVFWFGCPHRSCTIIVIILSPSQRPDFFTSLQWPWISYFITLVSHT
jgi:hypothetical protein